MIKPLFYYLKSVISRWDVTLPYLGCDLLLVFQDHLLVAEFVDCLVPQLVLVFQEFLLVAPLGLVDNHFFYDQFVCICRTSF